jgi:hypothetical protein
MGASWYAVPTEEHLEKLRRFVDEWCGTVRSPSGLAPAQRSRLCIRRRRPHPSPTDSPSSEAAIGTYSPTPHPPAQRSGSSGSVAQRAAAGQVRNVTDELEGASTGQWTWGVGDVAANPIRLAPTPVDVVKAQHLVSAENPAFASVTKVFSYLAAQVATLKHEAEADFFPRLLMFGERCGAADLAPEGDVQCMLVQSLPALQLLVAFIDQLQRVAHQLLHQVKPLSHERAPVCAWVRPSPRG